MSDYFDGTLESMWFGTSKNKGTPQIVYKIVLADGKSVFAHSSITENTQDKVIEELDFVGYPHQSFEQLDPAHPEYYSGAGVVVKVRRDIDPQFGEQYRLVTRAAPSVDPQKVKAVDQQFKGMWTKRKQGGGVKIAPPRQPLPSGPPTGTLGDGEEAPF